MLSRNLKSTLLGARLFLDLFALICFSLRGSSISVYPKGASCILPRAMCMQMDRFTNHTIVDRAIHSVLKSFTKEQYLIPNHAATRLTCIWKMPSLIKHSLSSLIWCATIRGRLCTLWHYMLIHTFRMLIQHFPRQTLREYVCRIVVGANL